MVFRTEEGSLAKSGFAQPAFLNFDAELLYPPAHHMQVRCASSKQRLFQSWLRSCISTVSATRNRDCCLSSTDESIFRCDLMLLYGLSWEGSVRALVRIGYNFLPLSCRFLML